MDEFKEFTVKSTNVSIVEYLTIRIMSDTPL